MGPRRDFFPGQRILRKNTGISRLGKCGEHLSLQAAVKPLIESMILGFRRRKKRMTESTIGEDAPDGEAIAGKVIPPEAIPPNVSFHFPPHLRNWPHSWPRNATTSRRITDDDDEDKKTG
jgi:hypothetical protein